MLSQVFEQSGRQFENYYAASPCYPWSSSEGVFCQSFQPPCPPEGGLIFGLKQTSGRIRISAPFRGQPRVSEAGANGCTHKSVVVQGAKWAANQNLLTGCKPYVALYPYYLLILAYI